MALGLGVSQNVIKICLDPFVLLASHVSKRLPQLRIISPNERPKPQQEAKWAVVKELSPHCALGNILQKPKDTCPCVSLTELGHVPTLRCGAAKQMDGAVCPWAFGNLLPETVLFVGMTKS